MLADLIYLILILVFPISLYSFFIGRIIIYDYEKALLYRKGKFIKILDAGMHRYLKLSSNIDIVDTRNNIISVPGQEVLTKDNVSIKLSLTGFYSIVDPVKTKHNSTNYHNELYNYVQILLRKIVSNYEVEELLESKNAISEELTKELQEKISSIGLEVSMLNIRDIMLPASMKKAFSGIVEAKKEAQTQLEKARGEDALLRKLANSSKMYENNPSLLQSRVIQTLSTNKNNTIIFGADGTGAIVNKESK